MHMGKTVSMDKAMGLAAVAPVAVLMIQVDNTGLVDKIIQARAPVDSMTIVNNTDPVCKLIRARLVQVNNMGQVDNLVQVLLDSMIPVDNIIQPKADLVE